MFRFILQAIVIVIGVLSTPTASAEFPECFNQPIGTFLPVNEDCTKAIYCNGIDSSIVECDEQNPYFSALEKMCYNDITVCEERFLTENQPTTLGVEHQTTTVTTTSVGTTTPRSTSAILATNVFVTTSPNPTTILRTTSAGYSTIRPTLPTIPSAPVISSTKTTTTTTTEAISTVTPSATNISCPLVDDPSRPLYLPHPQSCSQYYLCYHGMPMVMQCPNLLLFDVVQQSCNAAELVKCQLSSVSTPPSKCLPHMVMVYPHPQNCNYYYRCEFGYLKVMQCPFGMGWDYELAICTQLTKTKCYKPANGFFN